MQPRFLITMSGEVYGSRSEILYVKTVVIATAETRGWAEEQARRIAAFYGDADWVAIGIIDTRPAPRPVPAMVAEGEDDDLPF